MINKSISFTARISPNNKPITSNLIVVKKPITTKPTAMKSGLIDLISASFGKFVFVCN